MLVRFRLRRPGLIAEAAQSIGTLDPVPKKRVLPLRPGCCSSPMRYCRELYLKLMIGINWVPTKEQIADLFTKPLDKTTFLYLRTLLMSSGQTAL